ncbi:MULTISPECIES: ion channel [Pseudomonas]|uniref:ion channel n=1 Tax=Pseudomonas TaxID=286 RepID=UPI0018C9700C|nr:ion channel [Pseudomonas fluorescens]QPN44351.1 pentapeptide repeat-containing protein [Priestia aryabhattai]UTL92346.1 ion channel [Pseudomonas fluorescens]HCF3951254.1 pentapeptide repeat-containing protein [Pseudomonas aeruginosa]
MREFPRITEPVENISIYDLDHGKIAGPMRSVELKRFDFEKNRPAPRISRIKNVTFRKCIFNHQNIELVNFYGCTFIDCSFSGAKFKSCEFHKCSFVDSLFYKPSFEDTYLDPKSFKFAWLWRRHYANVNVGLFQALYRNSKDMHQDKFAMEADKKFLLYKRFEYLFGKEKKYGSFIFSQSYDILLGSGYGVFNALIFTILGISLFACLIDGHLDEHNGLLAAFYFAVVSFTTVGYGDLKPEMHLAPIALTMLFIITSVIWCAIVTAIVVKRIIR